jgi:ADP-ribose pyrophosphatase YjhB (NUDIX family)
MKRAVRAIIVNKGNLLVMKRDKFGHEYYTLIGGHVELGESMEKALIREIHEETMVRTSEHKLVYIEETGEPYGTQYIYTCDYVSGTPMLHPNADERQINKGGENLYTPMWLPISKLRSVPFRSNNLKQKLIKHLADGFPSKVSEFKSVIT